MIVGLFGLLKFNRIEKQAVMNKYTVLNGEFTSKNEGTFLRRCYAPIISIHFSAKVSQIRGIYLEWPGQAVV